MIFKSNSTNLKNNKILINYLIDLKDLGLVINTEEKLIVKYHREIKFIKEHKLPLYKEGKSQILSLNKLYKIMIAKIFFI